MGRFFSEEDVARWQKVDARSISVHREKLATALPDRLVDFHLGGLAGSYYMQGMAFIAQGDFEAAIQSFRDSVETRCKMYERFEMGQGRYLEAGHFQTVLVSFVTHDESLVSRLVDHYRADEGTPDSMYLGRVLKQLASGDIDGAKAALAERRPQFEPQFVGYAECLEAIVSKDEQQFLSALRSASESWAKWASKRVKGLPDSVCFIQGVGLVRLAEKVLGKPIPVEDENMPEDLLR
jgi:hypothetical protein